MHVFRLDQNKIDKSVGDRLKVSSGGKVKPVKTFDVGQLARSGTVTGPYPKKIGKVR
jgi:hypothetical protein